MGVRKRIEKEKEEIDVEALIDKGAHVKEDQKKENKEWTVINVRISTDMLQAVDKSVGRRVGITRTGWILESIHEKLTSHE